MKHLIVLLVASGMVFAQAPAKAPQKPAAPKAEPAKPAAPAKTPAAAGFVGNKDSKTYHKADCKMAAKMKDANKLTLASKEEAEKQGYKACKVCLK